MPELSDLVDELIVEHLRTRFKDAIMRLNDDGSLYAEINIPIVHKTKSSGLYAFANSVLSYSKLPMLEVILEDGSPFPPHVLHEVDEITERLTEEIEWEAGDVVVLDNWRFMHGRRAFTDNRRETFAALSFT